MRVLLVVAISLCVASCTTAAKREPSGYFSNFFQRIKSLFWSAPELPKGVVVVETVWGANTYEVISIDPSLIEIKMTSFATAQVKRLKDLQNKVETEKQRLVFAVNGGMYHKDLNPVGLYAENGNVVSQLNLEDGEGNFFLKPNGIFALTNMGPQVMDSRVWPVNPGFHVDYATQSGPMLVIEGLIHPLFKADSPNLNIRSGVGVSPDGRVHFVLSKNPVRFYDLALFFKDNLQCANALYLDGVISKSTIQDRTKADEAQDLGTFIYATQNSK